MSADTDRISAQLMTKYNSAAQFEFRLNQQETWQVGQKEICLILSIYLLLSFKKQKLGACVRQVERVEMWMVVRWWWWNQNPPPPRDPHPTRWEKSETSDVWLMLSSYAESIYRHYGGTGYAFLPVVDRGPPRINTRDSAHWFTDRFVSAVPNFFLSEAPSTMRHCEMSSSAPSNTPDRTNAAQVQVCAILEHSAPPHKCTAQLGQWMEGRENSGSCGHLLY